MWLSFAIAGSEGERSSRLFAVDVSGLIPGRSVDFLIRLRRRFQPLVHRLGLAPIARSCYRRLLEWRYGADGLAWVRQNGRTWKYHYEVALRDEFQEYDTVLWLRQIVRPGDCVLDIGANVGQMTLEAATLTGPRGRVVAIEPAPGNLRLLHTHLVANLLADRVTVISAACGTNHGSEISLRVCGATPEAVGSGHTVQSAAVGVGHWCRVDVPMVSVDGVCQELAIRPAVVKIDVEGAELIVLRGAVNTLAGCRPRVRMAFHPHAFSDPVAVTSEICQLLRACGYQTPDPGRGKAYGSAEYLIDPLPSDMFTGSACE
jgi:FkbM family methyltransferase